MSDIARLYDEVCKAVPNCEYVRVPRWHLRTTWEAVPRDGDFTPEEREKIAAVFDTFRSTDDGTGHGDVGGAGNKLGISAIAASPSLTERMRDLERRMLMLELRFSAKALDEEEHAEAEPGAR